jgi:hypothetical protein
MAEKQSPNLKRHVLPYELQAIIGLDKIMESLVEVVLGLMDDTET